MLNYVRPSGPNIFVAHVWTQHVSDMVGSCPVHKRCLNGMDMDRTCPDTILDPCSCPEHFRGKKKRNEKNFNASKVTPDLFVSLRACLSLSSLSQSPQLDESLLPIMMND